MRFKADGPAIPDSLLEERDAGNVVFLCGAGVSIPSGMPDFLTLAKDVKDKVGPPSDSEIRQALKTYDETSPPAIGWHRLSLDRVFQKLYREYGREEVLKIVWERLTDTNQERLPRPRPEGWEHDVIARLSANEEGHPQIVTTNFDRLFETAIDDPATRIYEPPMYPDLQRSPTGITYLHGRLADSEAGPHNYILSSADLGRAYLAEGWAARFVRELLQRYTVVLLGYKAEDPPVRYLLQGLDSANKRSWDRLFAFDKGDDEDVRAKWSGRGVRAIPYNDHDVLWDMLEAWADRADNPTKWRTAVAELSGKGPQALAPHKRGMVAHLVKTAAGAKAFAEREPKPPAEWLCVFDVNYRYSNPRLTFGDIEPFDPLETYRLDDDPPRPTASEQRKWSTGDDLVSWRRGDESADRWRRLSDHWWPQHPPLPSRLSHLAGWLASQVTDPVLAWWVVRQPALHPRLHLLLQRAVDDSPDLINRVRQGWMVVLDALDGKMSQLHEINLPRLKKRITKHGWTPGLIQELEALTAPEFDVGRPMTLEEPQPPSGDWSTVEWTTVADFGIRFPAVGVSWPPVPDADLPRIYAAVERNLMRASERIREIGWRGSPLQTFYPQEGNDARRRGWSDQDAFVHWFRQLVDRLSTLDEDRLRKHIVLWPDADQHIFDKLRLYVWSKSSLYSGAEVGDYILALSEDQFWQEGNRRELVFLLHRRWAHFTGKQRRLVGRRILDGPVSRDDEGDAVYGALRQRVALVRFAWLFRARCAFPEDLVAEWQTLKDELPEWDDGWVDHAIETRDGDGVRDVETNEDASVLDGVPVKDIVRVALKHSGRTRFGVNEPFTGLVKNQPGRAIRALGSAARRSEFPAYLWSSTLRHWPDNAPPRATTLLHGRLGRLPPATIVAMSYPVGVWLEKKFPDLVAHDIVLAYQVFDHFVEALLTSGSEELASHRGELIGSRPGQASRPTLMRAVNASIGKAVKGLIEVLSRDKPEQGTGLPGNFKIRFERLLSASGEGADDAVCVLSSQIAWLNWIDPRWVDAKVIPWFHPDHDRTESAWNGILSARIQLSIRPHFDRIKEGFLALPNTMYGWGWRERTQKYSTSIVELALSSQTDEPGLSFEDARRCLQQIRAEDRQHVIWFLRLVGKDENDRWQNLVIPFIRNAWPNERKYRTMQSSKAWLGLLCHTGDAFPDVLDAVRNHLGAIDVRQAVLPKTMEPLTKMFPQEMLELLDRVAPDGVGEAPYGLSRVLDLLAEAKPALIDDTRYRRLHRLAARE